MNSVNPNHHPHPYGRSVLNLDGLRCRPSANNAGGKEKTPGAKRSTTKFVLSSKGLEDKTEDTPDVDALYDQPTAAPPDELPMSEPAEDDDSPALGTTEIVEPEEVDAEIRRDFGEYEILSELGRGAMGIVYKARHKHLRREVALKVMLVGTHASKKQVARFYKEAQAAAKLRHPNIVPIFDIDKRHGRHFYTMDFVQGKGLNQHIGSGEIYIRGALNIVIKIAHALEYAHAQKVVHRDVKPSNIIIDMNGEPQLMDFGLAKQLDSGTKFTQTGSALGTPAYMSPEQAAGESHRVDHRSDIYSLGAVLYELVTGRPPFEGDNMMKVIIKVLNHDPVLPRQINPKIHRDIQTIIMKAMEKNPERRYPDMKELAADLNRFLTGEAILARPTSFISRGWRKIRKHTTAIVAVSIACIIAGLSMVTVHISREQVKKAEIEAGKLQKEIDKKDQEDIQERIPQKVQAVADDFSSKRLSKVWKPQSEDHEWRIADGELAVHAKGESVILLEPKIELKGNVKFDFNLLLPSEAEDFRVDCLIGEDQGQAFRLIIQSGDPHPQLKLQRSGAKLAEVDVEGFTPGKPWHCSLERRSDQIRFEFREPGTATPAGLLRYKGLELIRSLGASKTGKFLMGFAVWDGHARFDNVLLTKESAPEKGILYPHQQSILYRAYDYAKPVLTDFMNEHKDEIVRLKAKLLLGLCYELENQYRPALKLYNNFPESLAEEADEEALAEFAELYRENALRRFFCFVRTGRLNRAATIISGLTEKGVLIDPASVWHFRDVLQRCLVTPRLDEALLLIQKARFEGSDFILEGNLPEYRLFDLSKSIGQNVHSEFLAKAIRLAVKLGSGTIPKYSKVLEAYEAFPAPQMAVAIESSLTHAIRAEKLDDALSLLKFSSDRLTKSEKLDGLASRLAMRFCSLKQFASVTKVYESYQTPLLTKSYRTAVDGLLKQGERDEAKGLFMQAKDAFTKEQPDEKTLATIESMGVELMNAYARTGDYPDLIEILNAFTRTSAALVTPVETALARSIEKEEFEQAIELLKVVRERSLPPTEGLNARTLQLAESLAEKQKVVSFISAYNAYPVKHFAGSLVKLLKVCQANEAYANCVELLKFGRDKLDAGEFKDVEEDLSKFLLEFADAAIKRKEFQQVIAAHRAYPTDDLKPAFISAIKAASEAPTAKEDSPLPALTQLTKLLSFSRQQWPYPAEGELRQRLVNYVVKMSGRKDDGSEQDPPVSDKTRRQEHAKLLAVLVADYRSALENPEADSQSLNGIMLELADVLLLSRQKEEAEKLLQDLMEKLPQLHSLKDDALLRQAVISTDNGDAERAKELWGELAKEGGEDGPYLRLPGYMAGEAIDDAFTGLADANLQKLLGALRLKSTGATDELVKAAFTELDSLQTKKLEWYSSIVRDNLAAKAASDENPTLPKSDGNAD